MKIIHTADLHLDSRLRTNFDGIKARERRLELLSSFERLIKYARENNVEAIIIAGDMFDSAKISLKTKEYVIGLIESNPVIDFIYLSGNHDEEGFISSLKETPNNLITFNDRWKTINLEDCDVTGIIYNNQSKIYMYDTLNLDKNKKNIVVLHGDIGNDININLLKNKGIDYLALGHIHKFIKGTLDDRGVYAYSGCLEGRGFDEIGPKGFILLDIDEKEVKSEFIEFQKRCIHEIEVDITGMDSWNEIRKNVYLKLNGIENDDIVRIKLVGSYTLNYIKQIELLAESLNDDYYFVDIVDESKVYINPKDYKNDISLKGEFVRSVYNSNLTDEEKNQVIEFGIKALMKEDI